jgi:hypothetical protein
MRVLLLRIGGWFRIKFALRRLYASEKLLIQLQPEKERYERLLIRDRKRWKSAERLLLSISEDVAEHLDGAEAVRRKEDHAMELVQQENQIYKEVVIPNLTEENQRNMERVRGETAIEVRKQIPPPPNEDV